MSEPIAPLVLTFNEEPNLGRTLDALRWAPEVVVLDSGSTDRTLDIARSFPNVRVEHRPFDSFASQFAAGAALCRTNWILALDADHVVTPELVRELREWRPAQNTHAYKGRFRYCIGGRPLRASLYPPRVVLFNRATCRYEQEGHHQVLLHPGEPAFLKQHLLHDDRKSISRWLQDQERYAKQEAERLTTSHSEVLTAADRIRRAVIVAPLLVFLGALFGRGLVFDGWPGWVYVCQRVIAELILSLRLSQARVVSLESPTGGLMAVDGASGLPRSLDVADYMAPGDANARGPDSQSSVEVTR